jgi:DNA invertase Pin-like site-specific DNA recombinase
MQALEGVSLEAQSEKIKAYCKLHGASLIGIYKDEGLSAKSLERPGLKSALTKLEQGKANALLVVKLDRLTRSLLDLDTLIRGYFAQDRYHLLSVNESLDTRTAMGRFVLYILGLIAQWERESIGERTREALAHLKHQGVKLGAAPYGQVYSNELDADGRKRLVEVPEQMAVIARILEMFDAGISARKIAERLSLEGIAAPLGGLWYGGTVRQILDRHERPSGRKRTGKRIPRVWDRERATALAVACRKDGLSLRAIAKKLDAAKLAPPRGGKWHASTVLLLLGPLSAVDAVDDRTRAQQLRAEGRSLREIGRMLLAEGYLPPHAAQWHTQALAAMLASS